MSAVGVVHVWMVPPAATVLADQLRTLSPSEHARVRRFRSERDAARFVAARQLLRRVLGERLGSHPAEVPLSEGPWGRPQLDVTERSAIAFSIAHSRDRSILAVCADTSVGVDLEVVESGLAWRELLSTSCSADELARFGAEDDIRGRLCFYRRWVAKEAALKCLGVGLRISPTEVETFDDEQGDDCYIELRWPSRGLDGRGEVLAAVALAPGVGIPEVIVEDDGGLGAADFRRRSLCFPAVGAVVNG